MEYDFKAWVLRRRIAQIGDNFNWDAFTRNPRVDLKLVQENMDKPWNWALFGTCFIQDVLYEPLDKSKLTEITDVTVDFCIENGRHALGNRLATVNKKFIQIHKSKGFTLKHLGIKYNRKVTIEHMLKYKTSHKDWYDFSSNPNCQFINILQYPDKSWDWQTLSQRIPFSDIKTRLDFPWIWTLISSNKSVTIQDIIEFHHMPWDFKRLSIIINAEDMLNHPEFAWNWAFASLNPTVTLEHILKYRDLEWDWEALIKNEHVTFEDILKHDDLPWGSNASYAVRYAINKNPNLTLMDITEHPMIPYKECFQNNTEYMRWQSCFMWEKKAFDINWILLHPQALIFNQYPASRHAGIKWQDVKKYSQLPWCYRGLSMNPNIPLISILARSHLRWDWHEICRRIDFLEPLNEHEARKYLATRKICNQIMQSFTNPEYLMCRKRLAKEFSGLAT